VIFKRILELIVRKAASNNFTCSYQSSGYS
jgi:hypothetical protein